jgi:hypothetical protein
MYKPQNKPKKQNKTSEIDCFDDYFDVIFGYLDASTL